VRNESRPPRGARSVDRQVLRDLLHTADAFVWSRGSLLPAVEPRDRPADALAKANHWRVDDPDAVALTRRDPALDGFQRAGAWTGRRADHAHLLRVPEQATLPGCHARESTAA